MVTSVTGIHINAVSLSPPCHKQGVEYASHFLGEDPLIAKIGNPTAEIWPAPTAEIWPANMITTWLHMHTLELNGGCQLHAAHSMVGCTVLFQHAPWRYAHILIGSFCAGFNFAVLPIAMAAGQKSGTAHSVSLFAHLARRALSVALALRNSVAVNNMHKTCSCSPKVDMSAVR